MYVTAAAMIRMHVYSDLLRVSQGNRMNVHVRISPTVKAVALRQRMKVSKVARKKFD